MLEHLSPQHLTLLQALVAQQQTVLQQTISQTPDTLGGIKQYAQFQLGLCNEIQAEITKQLK